MVKVDALGSEALSDLLVQACALSSDLGMLKIKDRPSGSDCVKGSDASSETNFLDDNQL